MLKLVDSANNYITYKYFENDKELGEVALGKRENNWVEILFLKVYEERKGIGSRFIMELLYTLPYIKYFGSSRFKYYPFWTKLGAEYKQVPTEEEIELDQDDDDELTVEYLSFTLENKKKGL